MDFDQEEHIDEEQSSSEETAKTNGSNLSSELNSRDDESKKEKLKIKFKISKTEEEEEEAGGGEIDVSQDKGLRTCPFCQKKFSNGKALGGHVRIHTQPKSKDSFSKKKIKLSGKNDGLDPGKGLEPTKRQFLHCDICNRDFPSEKSLFGHMRYHPERNWRGMQQPVIKEPNVSSPTGPEPDDGGGGGDQTEGSKNVTAPGISGPPVDLLKDLPKWLRKDRRNRECTSQAETEPESNDGLMILAIAAALSSCQSVPDDLGVDYPASKRWKGDVDQAHQVAGTQKKRCNMGDTPSGNNQSLSPLKKLKTDHRTLEAGNRKHAEWKTLASLHNDLDGNTNRAQEVARIQKKRYNMGDTPSGNNQSPSPLTKLKTDRLMSSSKTTEAGYRKHAHYKEALASFDNDLDTGMIFECRDSTSPRKDEKPRTETGNIKAMGRGSKRDTISREESDAVETSEKQYSKPKQYKCSTCHKIFPTFQALGGHRSSHNKEKGTLVVELPASAEALLDEKKSSNGSTTPPIMETGGETGTIYQCDICNMTFPTGQALGGHKRWHWSGTANQSLSSEIESPGRDSQTGPKMGSPGDQGSHSGPGRRASGIDLNMPPAMDEEDGPL